jgi:hypothetical protein
MYIWIWETLGFWNEGYMGKGREMGRSVYEQPGNDVDGIPVVYVHNNNCRI